MSFTFHNMYTVQYYHEDRGEWRGAGQGLGTRKEMKQHMRNLADDCGRTVSFRIIQVASK